jgi:hypothetical protein
MCYLYLRFALKNKFQPALETADHLVHGCPFAQRFWLSTGAAPCPGASVRELQSLRPCVLYFLGLYTSLRTYTRKVINRADESVPALVLLIVDRVSVQLTLVVVQNGLVTQLTLEASWTSVALKAAHVQTVSSCSLNFFMPIILLFHI